MYGINCSYYDKFFETINELITDIIQCGQDPSYEITYNGKGIGENAIDHIVE